MGLLLTLQPSDDHSVPTTMPYLSSPHSTRLVKFLRPEALAAYLRHVRSTSAGASAVLLGLDVGDSKVGVSIADRTLTLAQPLARIDRPARRSLLFGQAPGGADRGRRQPETFPALCGRLLSGLIKEHRAAGLVVGYPLTLWEGKPSLRCREVLAFMGAVYKESWEELSVPFAVWDERMTTQMAREALRGEEVEDGGGFRRGKRKGERRRQALEDQVAATIILQSYLERHIRPDIA
ncbi:holliday junction resolvase [Nannochloropsis gaditana]|uniref:Holliday junction resolvase n=1 Tax=Nannochloropsis gaditana TaxID=72520 RepID=W7U0T0_9STRA|nr:holliday junction resolvase [Nannochloropsis gaditana]